MTLQIDLDPRQERELEMLAANEGVSVGEYALRRLLPTHAADNGNFLPNLPTTDSAQGAAPLWREPVANSIQTQLAAVLAYVKAPKEEIARLHAPDIAQFEAQLAESANATPEEIAEADAEWEEHKRPMNENRAATGERPLFADVTPRVRSL